MLRNRSVDANRIKTPHVIRASSIVAPSLPNALSVFARTSDISGSNTEEHFPVPVDTATINSLSRSNEMELIYWKLLFKVPSGEG